MYHTLPYIRGIMTDQRSEKCISHIFNTYVCPCQTKSLYSYKQAYIWVGYYRKRNNPQGTLKPFGFK